MVIHETEASEAVSMNPVSERGETIPDPLSYEENGRSWQNYKPDKYFLPNDAKEQARLDYSHSMFVVCLEGLYLAPLQVDSPRVLDLGTGTGIWAHEFAEHHPNSHVIGTDLSLIQPDRSKDIPNVEFIREDIEDEWVFKEPFDFVHMRLMFSALYSHKDVVKKIYDNLKPGGWFEYQDLMLNIDSGDNSHRGTTIHKWGYLALAGAAAKGRDMEVTRKYKDYLTETGFVDVVEKRFKVFGNAWPENETDKKIGEIGEYNGIEVVKNASLRLLHQGLGMPEAEVEELVAQTVKDIHNTDIHFYWPAYAIYGRKPFDSEITGAIQVKQ